MSGLAIYGGGHLARSLLEGYAQQGLAPPIRLHARRRDAAMALRQQFPFVEFVADAADLPISGASILLIVPPGAIVDLDPGLRSSAAACAATLVSCAGGLALADLQRRHPENTWARLLPNVNWQIGQGQALAAAGHGVDSAVLDRLEILLAPVTRVLRVAHDADFDRLGPVTACAPGLVAEWVAEYANAFGVVQPDEYRALLHALRGTLDALIATGKNPHALAAEVANPGGLTESGLLALRERLPATLAHVAERMRHAVEHRRTRLHELARQPRDD